MPFLQLSLPIGSADPAPLEDVLLSVGASSITLEDAEDNPVLEPAPGTTPLWPSVRLKALFDADVSRDEVLAALRTQVGRPLLEAHFEVIEDRAWEREWLKDFRPMRFGQRLWICPGGQIPPSDLLPEPTTAGMQEVEQRREQLPSAQSPEPVIVSLDPGLAFGTGTHPTTALCLEWLDGKDLFAKRIIDYGCGSGVLAIAALKLGAAEGLAVDIDSQALQASRDNAQRNGVASTLRVAGVEAVQGFQADILVANILAEPLLQLAPRFAQLLGPGAQIALSGILVTQAPDVARHYAPWFDIAPAAIRDDWARLDGVRRAH